MYIFQNQQDWLCESLSKSFWILRLTHCSAMYEKRLIVRQVEYWTVTKSSFSIWSHGSYKHIQQDWKLREQRGPIIATSLEIWIMMIALLLSLLYSTKRRSSPSTASCKGVKMKRIGLISRQAWNVWHKSYVLTIFYLDFAGGWLSK